jgi:hypothetical protein
MEAMLHVSRHEDNRAGLHWMIVVRDLDPALARDDVVDFVFRVWLL